MKKLCCMEKINEQKNKAEQAFLYIIISCIILEITVPINLYSPVVNACCFGRLKNC